ncbi:MAG: MgtC/SapB family protein [Oscillibacter sp.]|nr:MgtC/SapB family protein [Oscillibacter sp.]MCI8848787.1 MgtC/SapB family protein [Oscillibacter sp.]
MLSVLDGLRGVTLLSAALRLLLAMACGGLIGLERAFKRRPAGFRTHILICMGAAMTTLTSQYLYLYMGLYTDMARLGAQVVAGIGFIGAGTIMVTSRQRVKGLTTAAGLWASAIVGLALGGGFYEGGLLATVLILTAELLFSRLEYRMLRASPEISLFVEYNGSECLEAVLHLYRELDLKILNMSIVNSEPGCTRSAMFALRLDKGFLEEHLLERLKKIPGVQSIQTL